VVAFLLHLAAVTAATAGGVVIALVAGVAGQPALFVPVVVTAGLTSALLSSRLNADAAVWTIVPALLWFAGWAISSVSYGLDHFNRVFIGTGYCGDFSCAGQAFVTGPLVGTVAYAIVAQVADRARRSRS
jgi:hypothetical protein